MPDFFLIASRNNFKCFHVCQNVLASNPKKMRYGAPFFLSGSKSLFVKDTYKEGNSAFSPVFLCKFVNAQITRNVPRVERSVFS